MDAVLSASLLILVIAGLRAALLHRLPKRLLPPLWGLCLLRLVLPVLDGIVLPAVSVSLPVQAAAAQSAAQSAPLPLFCGGVGALLLCYFLLQHLGCLREYREALPCENESVEAFLAAHPLRRKVRVRVLDRLSSPLIYGVFRPVIPLPKQVCTEEALSFTLEHEFCHIRGFLTRSTGSFCLRRSVCSGGIPASGCSTGSAAAIWSSPATSRCCSGAVSQAALPTRGNSSVWRNEKPAFLPLKHISVKTKPKKGFVRL